MSTCARCGAAVDPRLLARLNEVRPTVKELIAADFPDWRTRGLCPDCVDEYGAHFAAQRSATPLNTLTDPHTTFPYYHPAEETLLAQPQRLADYGSFGGAGVTIAFLDSGFYPHPDLLEAPLWPDEMPAWARLGNRELRTLLEHRKLRLVHYVDLTDGIEREGLHLASLWDAAGYSWHGQMTTTIAAGNGMLSGGLLRGFASKAGLLPIKVGQSSGRIPESAILAGLRWLLKDNNWRRYGVRVVNISVGGDAPINWEESELSLAAEQLSYHGVLVAAASGNSGRAELLPPAQSPSVLTVGGYDDRNRRWSLLAPDEIAGLGRYHHNFGKVTGLDGGMQKPEILGLAQFVPSPILPGTPTFREMHAIDALRRTLSGADDAHAHDLLDHWQRVMHVDDPRHPEHEELEAWAARFDSEEEQSLHEVWQALRKRMNAHKWVHPYYQHVDGTSVAVAQVSAVAAQMFQANPRLNGQQVKALLLATALAMPHWPREQRGEGILQPAAAVAAALRAPGGLLAQYPLSGAQFYEKSLRKWVFQGKVPRAAVYRTGSKTNYFTYLGIYAPKARAVSLVGSFNNWTPEAAPLVSSSDGWWQIALELPPGDHRYRFWITSAAAPGGEWLCDPENPLRFESGYETPYSLIRN